MAYLSSTDTIKPRKSLLSRLYDAMIGIGEKHSRAPQIAALDAMTDQQLARRGIRREMIVAHVFRDKMYI